MRASVCLLLAAAVALAVATPVPDHIVLQRDHNPVTGEDLPTIRCGTTEAYEWRRRHNMTVSAPNCAVSTCDDPYVRDNTPRATVTIRVAFTVVNDVMTSSQLDATIAQFQKLLAASNITAFITDRQFVADTTYGTCLPPYGSSSDDWYYAILDTKKRHAISPEKTLNVFVTCQTAGTEGTLLGIATFPWDDIALTGEGGLWMNYQAMDPEDATLIHETGHCLGLWHTFHGYDEVNFCSSSLICPGANSCCESVHAPSEETSANANLVGDHCSDTHAQPREYNCGNPEGGDCKGNAWTKYGNIDYSNFMGYAMIDPSTGKKLHCQDNFSEQQTGRMHCYLRSEYLDAWVCPGDDCN